MKFFKIKFISSLIIATLFLGVVGSVYTVHLCVEKVMLTNFSDKKEVANDVSKNCCCTKSTKTIGKCNMKQKGLFVSENGDNNSCCHNINAYFNIPLYQTVSPDFRLFLNQFLIGHLCLYDQQFLSLVVSDEEKNHPPDLFFVSAIKSTITRTCVFLI